MTVPEAANAGYIGTVLAVIHGKGQGQSLRINAAAGNTYTLDAPGFTVLLDASSVVVVRSIATTGKRVQ